MSFMNVSHSLPVCTLFAATLAAGCGNAQPDLGADRAHQIRSDLAAFRADPQTFMNQIPPKRDRNGQVIQSRKKFPDQKISSGEYVELRDEVRGDVCNEQDSGEWICLGDALPGKAPVGYGDRAENLVDNPTTMVRSLREMDRRRLRKAKLAESPWSDDYWPMYHGQLGARYADPSYPERDGDYKAAKDYVNARRAAEIVRSDNATSIDRLSPAEKYDLMVGDADMTFTQANWAVGEQYYDQYGSVEAWMGLCHGWAVVSYMMPRPTNAITVKAANGINSIRLFPSDIKALATSLWSNVRTSNRFVGGRCNTKDPKRDENGRVIDPKCFDTNPATWHLSVVNQIGVVKRSFVMDATFDYEVWNHPVYSYDYAYFNPVSDEYADTLEEATVTMAEYKNDPFKKYRSANAHKVVGIAMDVTYVVETLPSHRTTDNPSRDGLTTVTYYYDIELDANNRVLGGEWYSNAHPDFLWTAPSGEEARPYADRFAYGDWDGRNPMNESWQRAAKSASSRNQPLGKIVKTLIGVSRSGL